MNYAFDCRQYLNVQLAAFHKKLKEAPLGGRTYIEFGGKIIDDQHAARVLPGFDPDAKLTLLRELQKTSSVVVAVSARDLLRPRIRGDTQLFYDKETVALVSNLQAKGVAVSVGVVTLIDDSYSSEETEYLESFFQNIESETGVVFFKRYRTPGYPHLFTPVAWGIWDAQERLPVTMPNMVVVSPGGGSGKFGVCLFELYHDYLRGKNSYYIKFETFPVFDLAATHPINRAFVAATADLGNVVQIESGGIKTTYDKDEENFALLARVHKAHCPDLPKNPITFYKHPSDMGVNRLLAGFVDMSAIERAAEREIERRRLRYVSEINRGIEQPTTLAHLQLHSR